jgi:glycerate kinase
MIGVLDSNLEHFAAIVARDLGVAIFDRPGSGAAGGLGGGLVAFVDGRLQGGVDLIIDAVNLSGRLAGADLCLTGEGAIDGQSAFGKTAVGVGRLARSLGCPTLALAGTVGPGAPAVLEQGISAYFSICHAPISLEQSMKLAAELLEGATEQAVRAFVAGRSCPGP